MSTNKIILRTTEEFMNDYQPIYRPIYPLFLAGKAQAYSELVGKVDFKRLDAVSDLRNKRLTPKDTEIHQIAVSESKKSFKKYFSGSQYQQSTFQDRDDAESVNSQVLDEHQKQYDEMFLMGDGGTSAETVVNNGLYWSADSNYTLENSEEIDTDADPLIGLYAAVAATLTKAKRLAGRKAIIFYGEEVIAKYNSLYAVQPVSFKEVLTKGVGSDVGHFELPSEITPANANGWIVVNFDRIKTHYTGLPGLKAQGVNEERWYIWANFLIGSIMVEVLTKDAVIRQPVTFEA